MEPFTIQCATCQSKIRVRDPNLLHQIAKCPRCHSMVQIEPPRHSDVAPPHAAAVDSMAMTKDAIGPHEVAPPHEVPPRNERPATGHAVGHSVGDAHEDSAGNSTSDGEDELRLAEIEDTPPQQFAATATNWERETSPLIPSEEWTSSATAKSRQYLMIACFGISGITIAGVLFIFFLRWYGSPQPSTAVAELPPSGAVAAAPSAAPDKDAADEEAGAARVAEATSAVADAGDSSPPTAAEGPDAMPEVPQADALPPGEVLAGGGAEQAPAAGMEAGVDELIELPTSLKSPAASGDSLNEQAVDGGALPKQLEAFAPLLSYNLQPVLPDTPVAPTQAPLTAEELGLDTSASEALSPGIDLRERLQEELPGLIIGDRPLSQAVNLWTHVSGIPTVVDFDSLAAAGIDRQRLVRVQQVEPARMGELASQLARAVGAVAKPEEDRLLRIAASADSIRAALPEAISLGGLVDGAEGGQWLEETLQQLYPETAADWSIVDGSLRVDLAEADLVRWFSILRLIENWRALAGQAAPATELSPVVLEHPFVDPQSLPSLDTQLKQVFPQPLPVGQALSRACAEVGLDCWIDWGNVGQGGLEPNSTQAVVTYNRSLRRTLADYATHYSLVVALLDEKSLWLTSPAAYRAQPRIYVLPSAGQSVEQWQQQLRSLTPAGPDGIGRLVVVDTPDSQFVIVRCCRPTIGF